MYRYSGIDLQWGDYFNSSLASASNNNVTTWLFTSVLLGTMYTWLRQLYYNNHVVVVETIENKTTLPNWKKNLLQNLYSNLYSKTIKDLSTHMPNTNMM